MPTHAYERVKQPNGKYLLRRQKATSFSFGCKKPFVQLYTMTGKYLDADPKVTKELKDFYLEEELEGVYSVEPCQFVVCKDKKSFFKKGKMSGEGTTRHWMPGLSVPNLIKPSLRDFAYAVAKGEVSHALEMKLIHDIDRLEDEIGANIDKLIEGAVVYIDKHVIPDCNEFWTPTFIDTLEDKLKNLVLSTRFNS